MKTLLSIGLLIAGFTTQAQASTEDCSGPVSKFTHVCNHAGNRWGICATKTDAGMVVQVSYFPGVRWGYGDAPVLLPTKAPGVWEQPNPSNRDWNIQEQRYTFKVIEDGKHAQLSSITLIAKGTWTKPWVEDLGDCPANYLIPKSTTFFP